MGAGLAAPELGTGELSRVEESGSVEESTSSGYSFGSCRALGVRGSGPVSRQGPGSGPGPEGGNLQGPVDDALHLVHDVVLSEEMLQVPEEGRVGDGEHFVKKESG